jgi:putative IMPACT (imprinted ancient) family translation regulator
LAPAADSKAASQVLDRRSRAHTDATHHCWAYRTWSDGDLETAGFDAGEPSGTAGRPILGALERADVVNSVCVVSRWFGGTRLGTGGLARAYADAARLAVEAAIADHLLPDVEVWSLFETRFPYSSTSHVRRVAAKYTAREESADYGEQVKLVLSVPAEEADPFTRALAEIGAGTIHASSLGECLRP